MCCLWHTQDNLGLMDLFDGVTMATVLRSIVWVEPGHRVRLLISFRFILHHRSCSASRGGAPAPPLQVPFGLPASPPQIFTGTLAYHVWGGPWRTGEAGRKACACGGVAMERASSGKSWRADWLSVSARRLTCSVVWRQYRRLEF